MRPLLGLLAYASITGDHRRALPGAAAVELGHNFSLVHDDIEDDDRERRHRPTLWALHGIPQAINTGDMLFSLSRIALHRLTDLGFPDRTVLRLMRLYDQTCVALCEGQYLDIWMAEHDDGLSVELYFDMIGRKTAALISASIEAGAVLATDDEASSTRYRAFGWALGIAFQLNDDLLGIWGPERRDRQGADGRARARRRPCRSSTPSSTRRPRTASRLAALYANGGLVPEHVAEIVAILERTGAREYTRDQARLHRDRALAALDAAGTLERGAARTPRGDRPLGDQRLASLDRLREPGAQRFDSPRAGSRRSHGATVGLVAPSAVGLRARRRVTRTLPTRGHRSSRR